jgi:pimeloyl-ACP methyl ester carboxylesterase
MILRRFGWWNLWLAAGPVAMAVPSELDSLRNAKRTAAPGVFVVTGRDTVVPIAYQTRVADAYRGEKRFVRLPDSEHNAVLEGAAATEYQAALDWLWARSGGDSGASR